MGRWTQYDEDDYRLPEGTKRVGYDADTQRYTFQRGNELWLGEPGAEYGGHLTRSGTASDDQAELEGGRSDGYQALSTGDARPVHNNRYAYRTLLPFLLLVGVFLLFVLRFIVGHDAPIAPPHKRMCASGPNATKYHVKDGDSCWEIAQSHGTTVDALLNVTLNPGLECDRLRPGDVLCMPE
ncbi:carbohydrate-binding module family 50 protein [Ramaria rubella]|nr:carbohydrate-binding module family 50 protein [Ramaria rubella]